MFSWRSMAEPHGGAIWICNGAWEKGKVQEEVECPWRRLWGLEIINQSRGQPFRAVPARAPTTQAQGEEVVLGQIFGNLPGCWTNTIPGQHIAAPAVGLAERHCQAAL